ncbi:MAG: ribosome-associated translation inhibitor RaiA [Gemmatimonadota bacterium]
MQVRISSRRCEVPEAAKRRAEQRIQKMVRYDARLSAAEVVFSEERHVRKVEGILSLDGSEPLVATGEGDQFLEAVDRLCERLNRRLRRRRAALKERRVGSGDGSV